VVPSTGTNPQTGLTGMTTRGDPLPPLRVGLLWHSFRSDNLGVGALALANLAIVDAAARRAGRTVQVEVIGFGGRLDYRPARADVAEALLHSSRALLPFGALWRAIHRADIVLDIGAGDSWADLYGVKRFVWQWLSKEAPLWMGKPLVLSPQTIGPFSASTPRWLACRTMRRADKVFARDRESVAFLEKLKSASNAVETVDVAFRLPFSRPQRTASPDRIQFGFNVSGLLYAGGYTQSSQFGSRDVYRAMVQGVIEGLLARGDTDVTLVPHVVPDDGSVEDDIAVSRQLASRYPGVRVAPIFASPVEAKSFISGLDMLAGSRMHATIAAASAGIAVVPLAYSRKFRGVFNSIGYPLLGDCTAGPADALVALTLDAVDRRRELSEAARDGSARAMRKLDVYEDYLANLFVGERR
jgi:colanic acid/amylovoran biosynthesis protein